MIDIIPYGNSALLINFEQKIDAKIHHLVKGYFNSISNLDEVTYQIPAYCSITVIFDSQKTDFESLKQKIEKLEINSNETYPDARTIEIPVCYEKEYAPDLESLSKDINLNPQDIITQHTSVTYDVYMMGFLPGFPYLGELPKALECKRKSTPRKQVKAGSVAIAGNQTGIYPTDAPGGWQLIGQTPLKIFNALDENAFLIKMGDKVKFKSISSETFKTLQQNGK
ncbi:5-oxoprolinase subunit PxpB [Marivirga salinae]|uniref:5-oxoprolinase subunit PxpB n=1 Tax=Marivirga salinarum TaxID=3059078 RepID=A0AA49JB91_9BACT|nr:5-oxoprolinase subunit PxpB [Marivirga sp. BDSF4-3]WKK74161.2 5-oxoprolinase subunit PxpB [Marivirga sp. BDSF4-3]